MWVAGILLNALAQTIYQRVDRIVIVYLVVPDILCDLILADHLAFMRIQQFEQLELFDGQRWRQQRAVDIDFLGAVVDPQPLLGRAHTLEDLGRQRAFLGRLGVVEDDLGIGNPDFVLVAQQPRALDAVAIQIGSIGAFKVAHKVAILIML